MWKYMGGRGCRTAQWWYKQRLPERKASAVVAHATWSGDRVKASSGWVQKASFGGLIWEGFYVRSGLAEMLNCGLVSLTKSSQPVIRELQAALGYSEGGSCVRTLSWRGWGYLCKPGLGRSLGWRGWHEAPPHIQHDLPQGWSPGIPISMPHQSLPHPGFLIPL